MTAAIARGLSSPAEVASPAELSIGPERAGARIEFASRWGRGAVGPLHPSRARWGRAAAGPLNTRCVADFYSPRGLRATCPELMRPHVRTYVRGCAHAHVRMRAVAHARHERTYVRTSSTHARTYVRTRARVPWHVRKARARPQSARVRARMHIGTCARQVRALAIFSLPSLDQGGHASRSPPSVLLLRTSNVRIFSLRLPPRHLSVASLFCGLPARSDVIVRSEEACNCP